MVTRAKIKIDEAKTNLGILKGLEISIGKIVEDDWEEKIGPTPMPGVTDLRSWDMRLLARYKPMYTPSLDICDLCTFGKCDLTRGKRGACGIDVKNQTARMVLWQAVTGASAHCAHSRELLKQLIEKYGEDTKIDLGERVMVEAPLVRLITGIRPKTLKDLEVVLEYVEENLVSVNSALLTGQEGNYLDFESKALHAGMLDLLGMEVADIAQISAMNLSKGDPNAPLVEIGFGTIDTEKPVIMFVGHNITPGASVTDYLEKTGLEEQVELVGLCCSAHDLTRYNPKAKIVGHIAKQLKFIRSGIPDVVLVDVQCVRTDTLIEARKTGAKIIATADRVMYGLKDRSKDDPDEIVKDLLAGLDGVAILDQEKMGEVAVKLALKMARRKKAIKDLKVENLAQRCIQCEKCVTECHNNIDIVNVMIEASKGNLKPMADAYYRCMACGKCEGVCPKKLPIVSMFEKASEKEVASEKYVVRSGRGPVQDTEIRNVGRPIVFGEIPGIIGFVGCPNYSPDYITGTKDLIEVAKTFLERNFIVVSSGCAAMDLAMEVDDDGFTLYQRYGGDFDAGCFSNVGSCVANAHIAGAAIKVANIFALRSLRGNFEEIADYILNRVGAVGVVWGGMSQKAFSIALGCNRLGVPVIVGPRGVKYKRTYLGRRDKPKDWIVYNARDGTEHFVAPAPEHLFYVVETKEELIVNIAKFCIRPNDTAKGRQIKIAHYVDLYKRYFGKMPEDIHHYVRNESDIPLTLRDELQEILREKDWKPREVPDPTLLKRLCREVRE